MKLLTVFIILGFLIGGAMYWDYLDKNDDITFSNGEDTFTIDSKNLNDIISNENIPSNRILTLCKIGDDQCMLIKKGEIK